MALRLRRGTDAERQTITPLEGELIYTTDTEKLYVGDGTTVGGNPIDSDTITDQLSDLSDVSLTGLQDGQTIAYDANNNRFEPADLASSINDLVDVDTTGVEVGEILKWDGAAFVAAVEGAFTPSGTYNINIDGDVTGSVFGDDSTLIVDAVNNTVIANSVSADDMTAGTITTNSFNSLYIKPANTAQINTLTVEAIDQQAKINIRRSSDSNIIGSDYDTDGSGGVIWTRVGLDGDQLIGGMFGYENALAIFSNDTSNNFPESHHIIWRDGKLGVGVFFPSESLETSGNAVINGSIQGSEILIEANNITTTSTNTNLRLTAAGTGTIELDIPTQTTVGAAGAASALPASPDIYFKVNVDGTEYVVPGFAVS